MFDIAYSWPFNKVSNTVFLVSYFDKMGNNQWPRAFALLILQVICFWCFSYFSPLQSAEKQDCIASHRSEHCSCVPNEWNRDQKGWSHGSADPFFSFQVPCVGQKTRLSASMAEQVREHVSKGPPQHHHLPLWEFSDSLSGEDSIDSCGARSSEIHISRLNLSQGVDKDCPLSKAAPCNWEIQPSFARIWRTQSVYPLQPSISHNLLSLTEFFHHQTMFGNTT